MPELKDVTWVSITCDPDTDTLEALRAYADRWKADPERWLFCRADLDYIQRVANGMKVFLSLQGAPGLRDRHRQAGQDPRHVRRHERKPVQANAQRCCSNAWPRSRRTTWPPTAATKEKSS